VEPLPLAVGFLFCAHVLHYSITVSALSSSPCEFGYYDDVVVMYDYSYDTLLSLCDVCYWFLLLYSDVNVWCLCTYYLAEVLVLVVVAIGSVCLGVVDNTGIAASDAGTACIMILCLPETIPLLKNC
jgi:hypothetical protein